jgi:hypothetical protein
MKSKLFLIVYFLALATARIPTDIQQEVDSVTSILSSSLLNNKPTATDRIQLDLCDCQPATGDPGGLSCDKEGFFIASFERQGQWVAGGGAVPLSRAICCRPCLPTDLPDDSPIFDDGDRPLALVSMGCHASTDPLGVRCEADNTNANSFVSGFTSSVQVFSAVDTQYPVDTAQCCTPALLMESGDAWELERCDCGESTHPEHSVSCSIASSDGDGGGGSGKNSSASIDIATGSILSGFDFFRISPIGQVVPIGPAKCCGVCLTGKVHPAADCRDLNHCSGNGVCLLGRCECLQGWGSPDCSQSLAGKGGWGGKIPPWAISLIVIGSCLLAMIILSVAAHVAELVFEARSNRRGDGNGTSDDDDENRRPLLLRIDADDAGSVGSQDTEGVLDCDDEDTAVLLGGVEERIEQVIHRLEEGEGEEGEAGAESEVISDGEEDEEAVAVDEDVAGSSVPSSARQSGILAQTTEAEVETEEEVQQGDDGPSKPAAANSRLQSYMGIGPLSGVDCVVCMIRPVQTVVIPCGHVCMCRRCSRRLNRCPVCRKDVVRRQRLFV